MIPNSSSCQVGEWDERSSKKERKAGFPKREPSWSRDGFLSMSESMSESMDRIFGMVEEVGEEDEEDVSSSTMAGIDFPCTLSDRLNRKAVIKV